MKKLPDRLHVKRCILRGLQMFLILKGECVPSNKVLLYLRRCWCVTQQQQRKRTKYGDTGWLQTEMSPGTPRLSWLCLRVCLWCWWWGGGVVTLACSQYGNYNIFAAELETPQLRTAAAKSDDAYSTFHWVQKGLSASYNTLKSDQQRGCCCYPAGIEINSRA